MLSVTSCGSIYPSLSHQCTILYLHKKEECVCACVSVTRRSIGSALSVLAGGGGDGVAEHLLQ